MRGEDGSGAHRHARRSGGSEARRKLTEPPALFTGLGFEFWEPPIPPVIGQLVDERPGRDGRACSTATASSRSTARPISDFRDLAAITRRSRPGDALTVRYQRGGAEQDGAHHASAALKGTDGKKVGYIGVRPAAPKHSGEHDRAHAAHAAHGVDARPPTEAWDMTLLQARLVWRMMHGPRVAEESQRPAVDRRVRR